MKKCCPQWSMGAYADIEIKIWQCARNVVESREGSVLAPVGMIEAFLGLKQWLRTDLIALKTMLLFEDVLSEIGWNFKEIASM